MAPDIAQRMLAGWERDKDVVARAAHESWIKQKLEDGFEDHPYVEGSTHPQYETFCKHCQKPSGMSKHHPDMVPFEQLSEKDKAYDYATGRDAYLLGYLRCLADGD